MGRLFGTDGIRGLANADLTPELALAVALAAAEVLAATIQVLRDGAEHSSLGEKLEELEEELGELVVTRP